MLKIDLPTDAEIRDLYAARFDAAISIYVPTTPLTQQADAARIAFENHVRTAVEAFRDAGADKRRLLVIEALAADLAADREFWANQGHSLAVFLAPDRIRTFRLPNRLSELCAYSDRFHVKPLLRAVTFPHAAFVLALAENSVRLIHMAGDLPPADVSPRGLPESAADAVGKSTINDRTHVTRIGGGEGQKVLLAQYCRKVDAAIRPLLAGLRVPLILAATEPLASIYPGINTYPGLAAQSIRRSPDDLAPAAIADLARPILDGVHDGEIAAMRSLYAARENAGRASADIAQVARAATFGAVDVLLADMDDAIWGEVDPDTGAVVFADGPGPDSYGVVDEIAARTIANGGRVLAVRRKDLPQNSPLAAILRFAA